MYFLTQTAPRQVSINWYINKHQKLFTSSTRGISGPQGQRLFIPSEEHLNIWTKSLVKNWKSSREYWMIYRGPGFLALVRMYLLLPHSLPTLSSASCISISVFLCVADPAYWRSSLVFCKSFNTIWHTVWTVQVTELSWKSGGEGCKYTQRFAFYFWIFSAIFFALLAPFRLW
jgi:hypothetical protein